MGTERLVIVIESDNFYFDSIQKTLLELESSLKIIRYKDLAAFYNWFDAQIHQQGEKPEVPLVISEIRFLGPKFFPLIAKLKVRMGQEGFCKPEDLTRFVITSFDDPDMARSEIESRIINNVLFKPFDPLILKQHLKIALLGDQPLKDTTVFKQAVGTPIEMLKDVEMFELSEIGFKSKSYLPIKVGSLSKYYISQFRIGLNSSLFARCVACKAFPGDEKHFEVEFVYTGISDAQTKHIRRELLIAHQRHDKAMSEKVLAPQEKEAGIDLIYGLDLTPHGAHGPEPSEAKTLLSERFLNIQWIAEAGIVGEQGQLQRVDFVVIDPAKLGDEKESKGMTAFLDKLKEYNQSVQAPVPLIFLLNHKPLLEKDERVLLEIYTDTIDLPCDRLYLYKRFRSYFPKLKSREELHLLSMQKMSLIKVANLIDVVDISETGLTIKYHRAMSLGAFRRFCLTLPHEDDDPEFSASCHHSEKSNDVFVNQFVFFGITDHYLKHIRRWMIEYHIDQKQKSQG